MNISETWKKLERERLERPIEGELNEKDNSRHPVEKLKKNYFIKTMMMVVFLALFVSLYFSFDMWLVRALLIVVMAAYTIFLAASFSMYRRIRTDLPVDGSLINMLTETKERISRSLRFETISSLLIYPFAGAAGYMVGYTVSGADVNKLFDNLNQIIIFIVVLVVFMVLGYYGGKRLTRAGYGKSLEDIGRMIEQLKRE